MNEKFLHYIWFNKLYHCEQQTTNGKIVEIISTGIANRDAGPDVFNAKVRIGEKIWAGNIEFHVRASEWQRHRHSDDSNYNNVVLHVVLTADSEAIGYDGKPIATVELKYPAHLRDRYEQIEHNNTICRCNDGNISDKIESLKLHNWLDRLLIERLEEKTEVIKRILQRSTNDWQQAFFVILARSFGFGTNADAMQDIAESIPYSTILHHRNNLEQVEAILLGQGGLLNFQKPPLQANQQEQRWAREYQFLKTKYGFSDPQGCKLKFLRMRPQSFPSLRLAQLAMLLHKNDHLMSDIITNPTVSKLHKIFSYEASEYWKTHYILGNISPKHTCKISEASINLLIINTVVPFLFYYGKYHKKETLQEQAIALLENLKPERNFITTQFAQEGIKCSSAYDSQAVIQLYRNYCATKKCLQCHFFSIRV